MPTTLTGRLPPSFSVTNYNEGLWGDSTPWGGIVINPTILTGRTRPGDYVYQTWEQSTNTWDSLTFTWDSWRTGTSATTLTGRITP